MAVTHIARAQVAWSTLSRTSQTSVMLSHNMGIKVIAVDVFDNVYFIGT